MSKARLEDIKTWLNRGFDLIEEDIVWLIEQAERAEELERKIERYREALKNIYDLAEYDEYDNVLEQIVSEVEKALEGDDD